MTGCVFDIRPFAVDDGDGVRTTVFLKGCPMRCLWCHNPEGQSYTPELSLTKALCVGCGRCKSVCPHPTSCTACGRCVSACVGARRIIGEQLTPEQVMTRVRQGLLVPGGLTLSGGEPLAQPAFAREIAVLAHREGLSVSVETSGYAQTDDVLSIAPYVDCFLYDIKETDPHRHRLYTGVDNAPILRNLRLLSDAGARIVLRCPVIPGVNDRAEHFASVAALAQQTDGVVRVEALPYHALGSAKYARAGRTYELADVKAPGSADMARYVNQIRAGTDKPVLNGAE